MSERRKKRSYFLECGAFHSGHSACFLTSISLINVISNYVSHSLSFHYFIVSLSPQYQYVAFSANTFTPSPSVCFIIILQHSS